MNDFVVLLLCMMFGFLWVILSTLKNISATLSKIHFNLGQMDERLIKIAVRNESLSLIIVETSLDRIADAVDRIEIIAEDQ